MALVVLTLTLSLPAWPARAAVSITPRPTAALGSPTLTVTIPASAVAGAYSCVLTHSVA
ncbi:MULTISPECIES: hypothetical protein [Pseudofrankia]|uniref:hypothetical protein n=1 Tax=Pseudofrankia TaxID=2994363 RepID=UPI000234B6C8|nr:MULTISPECIES: hypothetical protein [Pseudofrankia]